MNQLIKPTHLNIGDTIGVISPSAPMAGLVKQEWEEPLLRISFFPCPL